MALSDIDWGSIDAEAKMEAKWQAPLPKPCYTHASDKRVVLSLNVDPSKDTASLPKALIICMEQALEMGVPVQVQLEIIPQSCIGWTENDPFFPNQPGFYAYHSTIESVKARIKPGTPEFIGAEEKNLNHIIEDTESTEAAVCRAKKRIEKEKKKAELNRFTGLEV